MNSRTEKRIRMIGGGIGEVLEVDFDGIGWDRSARLKILVDVMKPLRRVQQVRNIEGSVVMIEVKYERLQNFCFGCGFLGHIERDCLVVRRRGVKRRNVGVLGCELCCVEVGLKGRKKLELSRVVRESFNTRHNQRLRRWKKREVGL